MNGMVARGRRELKQLLKRHLGTKRVEVLLAEFLRFPSTIDTPRHTSAITAQLLQDLRDVAVARLSRKLTAQLIEGVRVPLDSIWRMRHDFRSLRSPNLGNVRLELRNGAFLTGKRRLCVAQMVGPGGHLHSYRTDGLSILATLYKHPAAKHLVPH